MKTERIRWKLLRNVHDKDTSRWASMVTDGMENRYMAIRL